MPQILAGPERRRDTSSSMSDCPVTSNRSRASLQSSSVLGDDQDFVPGHRLEGAQFFADFPQLLGRDLAPSKGSGHLHERDPPGGSEPHEIRNGKRFGLFEDFPAGDCDRAFESGWLALVTGLPRHG